MNKHWLSTESRQRRQFAWAIALTALGFVPMFVIAAQGPPRVVPIPNSPLETQVQPAVIPVAEIAELER